MGDAQQPRPQANRRVGIRDVAAAAGVSRTTASDALTGNGRVGAATRDLVHATARRLGYRANVHARMLRGGRSGMLAIVSSMAPDATTDPSGAEYFREVVTSAATTAIARGYAAVLMPLDPDIGQLDSVHADGAIVLDPVIGDPILGRLEAEGVPAVTTGRSPDRPPDRGTWVDNEIAAAARGMFDMLFERGAKRVALLTNEPIRSYTVDTIAAYEEWARDRGVPARIVVSASAASESSGYRAAAELFEDEDPPDAVYAPLDRLALGALLAAQAKGLRIPEDLMIAAGSDNQGTRASRITALELNPRRIGETAAELLVDRIEGDPPADRHVIVPTTVAHRASTARGAGARGRLAAVPAVARRRAVDGSG